MTASSRESAREGLLVRLGQVRFNGERTCWLFGRRQEDFEAVADLVTAIVARYPRLELLFTAPQPSTRAWLRERYPNAVVLPPPLPAPFVANRYVLKLNVRALIVLGDVASAPRSILRAVNRRAAPSVVIENSPVTNTVSTAARGAVPERIEHYFVTSPAARERLLAAGIATDRITELPAAPAERTAATMTVMGRLLAQNLKLIRSESSPIRRRLEQMAIGAMEIPRLRRLLCAKVERYDDVPALREALGHPDTILCLGNGPSSEDPDVAKVRYDALFRVNSLWLKRGFLTAPDMVFTGSSSTLSAVRDAIFGLETIRSEARLLVSRLLPPRLGRLRYAAIERLGLFLYEPRLSDVRPTNGAIMLATAVALQPRHLVVAGVDLFNHPAGAYPGDAVTPNAYTAAHEPGTELALLLEALSLYEGDLTILSPALQERWKEFQSGRGGHRETG